MKTAEGIECVRRAGSKRGVCSKVAKAERQGLESLGHAATEMLKEILGRWGWDQSSV